MVRVANLGDAWARGLLYRIAQATRQGLPPDCPLQAWLFHAASEGSREALVSLKALNSKIYEKAMGCYRTTFCGNPQKIFTDVNFLHQPDMHEIISDRGDIVLHWIASTGRLDLLAAPGDPWLTSNVLNGQNAQGDTPLLCAAQSGHYKILAALV
jgi:hypothetical protein